MGDSLERYVRPATVPALRSVEGEIKGRQIRFGKEQIEYLGRYPVVKKLELHGPDGESQSGVIIPLPRGFSSVLVLAESGDGFILSRDDKLGTDEFPPFPIDRELWLSFHTVDQRTYTLIDGHQPFLEVTVSDFTPEGIGRGLLGDGYNPLDYIGSSNTENIREYYARIKDAGENISYLMTALQTGGEVHGSSLSIYADDNTEALYEGLAIRNEFPKQDLTTKNYANVCLSEE